MVAVSDYGRIFGTVLSDLLMCGMVIISYRILVCMDILKASYSGAFSILSSCRVCKNTFYGVFMF